MINLHDETLLRIFVMTQIQHPEEYYQTRMEKQGIIPSDLTHAELSVLKSTMLAIEADAIIHTAKNQLLFDIDKINQSVVEKIFS